MNNIIACILIIVLIIILAIMYQSKGHIKGSNEDNTENTWNPRIVIEQYEGFNVVRDDLLIGGTKQRGAVPLLKDMPQEEFIYAGPPTGFAQIALAYAAKLNNKKATLFINKHVRSAPMYKQTKIAQQLGASIHQFKSDLKGLRSRAEEYAKSLPHSSYVFKLGFDEDEFKDMLLGSLREAIKGTPLEDFKGTMWVVGGSATLANIFYKLFPDASINVVQVGKKIDWHINKERSDFYIAPEKFFEPAHDQPPYPSVPEYDAKVWQFAKKYGKPGDYIWNVAGIQ